MKKYLFDLKSVYSSFKLTGFITSTTRDVHQWYFTIVCKVKVFGLSPHFFNKPLAKAERNQSQQFTSRFKTRFIVCLFHLARKVERVFTHVQSALSGSFSSYQFTQGDVL